MVLLRPVVPFVDVQIGAADAGAVDADQDVVDADLRFGNVFEPQPGSALLLTSAFML